MGMERTPYKAEHITGGGAAGREVQGREPNRLPISTLLNTPLVWWSPDPKHSWRAPIADSDPHPSDPIDRQVAGLGEGHLRVV